MGNLTITMTGNFLTLLASLGTLVAVASFWRRRYERPVMVRVRIESTVRHGDQDWNDSQSF